MMQKILIAAAGIVTAALLASFVFTQWKAREISRNHPPRGVFADVDGARMHFTDMKPTNEAVGTIALVHGASGNESDLRLALGERLVAAGYRVISIDRPGHGWSTRDDDASTPDVQARQIRQTLEKAGVTRAIVAGHSLAGALTLQLALDHADLVEGVVLIAPVTHPWPGGVAAYYQVTAAPVIGPVFAHTLILPIALPMIDASLKTVFAPQSPPQDYRMRTGVDLVLRPQTFRANAIDVASMYDFVSREQARYERISIPVDIVTGDKDTIVLTHIHSYGSQRDIPGSTLHVMAGVGHSPHWAQPEEVIGRIVAMARKMKGTVAGR
jgi:pimeloyl-ACP methyl ester carboxylesterase